MPRMLVLSKQRETIALAATFLFVAVAWANGDEGIQPWQRGAAYSTFAASVVSGSMLLFGGLAIALSPQPRRQLLALCFISVLSAVILGFILAIRRDTDLQESLPGSNSREEAGTFVVGLLCTVALVAVVFAVLYSTRFRARISEWWEFVQAAALLVAGAGGLQIAGGLLGGLSDRRLGKERQALSERWDAILRAPGVLEAVSLVTGLIVIEFVIRKILRNRRRSSISVGEKRQ